MQECSSHLVVPVATKTNFSQVPSGRKDHPAETHTTVFIFISSAHVDLTGGPSERDGLDRNISVTL